MTVNSCGHPPRPLGTGLECGREGGDVLHPLTDLLVLHLEEQAYLEKPKTVIIGQPNLVYLSRTYWVQSYLANMRRF
jgi:hypothetical protein